MKYLKLFEAFESTILGKTLAFIKDDESKNQFMSALNKICSSIDYPKSELKDEYFQYLSFYPALKVSAKTGDEPCEAKSADSYPEYAVDGSKCEGGKVLRKWGARTREAQCTICKGTGVKPKKPEIKLIKFWFSTEGKYITATAVDGIVRGRAKVIRVSKNIEDYDIIGTCEDPQELQTGQIIRVRINGRQTICYMIKDRNSRYPFAIQDEHGGSPPDGIPPSEWSRFGSRSWHLSRGEYRGPIEILSPKYGKDGEVEEVDPYSWNVWVNLSGYGGIRIDQYTDVQEKIKDANFAIVLDFGKMKQSEFKTTYSTRSEREQSREGALALQKPEDIKATNIERYIKTLADQVASGDELTKVTRIIPRLMGGRNVLLYVGMGRNLSTIDSLATRLYRFMTDENDKDYHAREIVSTIKNSYKQNLQFTTDLNEVLDEIRKILQKSQEGEKYLALFDKMMEVSQKVNNKVFSTEVKSIEDIEYIYQKLNTIRNMISSSRNPANRLRYFMERLSYLSVDRAISRLTEIDEEEIPQVVEGLESIGRFVERA